MIYTKSGGRKTEGSRGMKASQPFWRHTIRLRAAKRWTRAKDRVDPSLARGIGLAASTESRIRFNFSYSPAPLALYESGQKDTAHTYIPRRKSPKTTAKRRAGETATNYLQIIPCKTRAQRSHFSLSCFLFLAFYTSTSDCQLVFLSALLRSRLKQT